LPAIAAAAITKNQKLLLIGKLVLLPVDDEPFPNKLLEVVVNAFAGEKTNTVTINKITMVNSFEVFMTVKDIKLVLALRTFSNTIPILIKEIKVAFYCAKRLFDEFTCCKTKAKRAKFPDLRLLFPNGLLEKLLCGYIISMPFKASVINCRKIKCK
jgi:hypothetical protein